MNTIKAARPDPAWVPVTPAGTPLYHLKSRSADEAWAKLLVDAAHMPYRNKAGFQKFGYTVEDTATGSGG